MAKAGDAMGEWKRTRTRIKLRLSALCFWATREGTGYFVDRCENPNRAHPCSCCTAIARPYVEHLPHLFIHWRISWYYTLYIALCTMLLIIFSKISNALKYYWFRLHRFPERAWSQLNILVQKNLRFAILCGRKNFKILNRQDKIYFK